MREPPAPVRFIAHPVVALPSAGMCALVLYACAQDPSGWPAGLIALLWGGVTLKASEAMKRYRDWQRAWNAMAEPVARPPVRARPWMGALQVAGMAAYFASNLDRTGHDIALTCTMLAGTAAAVAALVRRLRSTGRHPSPDRQHPVAVAVARPILPVPGLEAAYDALPAYCWQAINATRQ